MELLPHCENDLVIGPEGCVLRIELPKEQHILHRLSGELPQNVAVKAGVGEKQWHKKLPPSA